eukprot:5873902-Pyramimonas_sp.AAC.1
MGAPKTYHAPLCSTDDDGSCGLDSDEHGQYVTLCITAEKSKVVSCGQQHRNLDFDSATTTRVYVAGAAKRAAVVKEGDLLTKADVQAKPVKVSKALYTELMTLYGNECFKIQGILKASNTTTSSCACNTSGLHGPRSLRRGNGPRNGAA